MGTNDGRAGKGSHEDKKALSFYSAKTTQKIPEKFLINFGGGFDDVLDVSRQHTNFARLTSL